MTISKVSITVVLAVLAGLSSAAHGAPYESKEFRALKEACKRKLFESPV
jgi:hypothetical protein